MYIIVDGLVRVHDSECTLNYLGKEDVLGEMAALDPEPRSATVSDMVEDYQYAQQFGCLTSAAVALENGVYDAGSLDEVAERQDELGQLERVFQRMVRDVYAREQRMKQQVAELRIEIEQRKQDQRVAEITETGYFRHLVEKVVCLKV